MKTKRLLPATRQVAPRGTAMSETEIIGVASNLEPRWGWMWEHADFAEGPFDSREEAIADARASMEAEQTIDRVILGHVVCADPTAYLDDNLESHLERMDEAAREDTEFSEADGEIFEAREGAAEALTAALKAWALEYLYTGIWSLSEVETLEITR